MAMRKTVRLYGALGARFGRVHQLHVQTPAEAVKALCVTLDGFERYLMSARENGMVFTVFKGKHSVGEETLSHGSGDYDIRIAPIMTGSKKAGMFQTILGAVLVVAGLAISYFSGGTAAAVGMGMAKFGAMMMIGGAFQMLSPQPKGLKMRQDPDNAPSYAFGSAVNTTALGNPVGILWGRREIGGSILSAGIIANEIRT